MKKIVLSKEKFAKLIGKVSVNKKNSLNEMGNYLKVIVDGKSIEVQSINPNGLSTIISEPVQIGFDSKEPIAFLIETEKAKNLKLLEGENITFEFEDDMKSFSVKTDKSTYKWSSLDASLYPLADNLTEPVFKFEIGAEELKSIYGFDKSALATEETRPILTTLMCAVEKDRTVFEAMDGYRLHISPYKMEISDGMKDFNLPRELCEYTTKLTGILEVQIFSNMAKIVSTEDNTVVKAFIKLIDAQIVSYKQVLNEPEFQVGVNGLLGAVERLILFTNDRNSVLKLTLSNGSLEASMKSEAEENKEVLPLTEDSPKKDFEIAFNAGYIIDALKSLKSDVVRLGLTDKIKPVLIRSDDFTENSPTAIVLPVRIVG